MAQRQEEYHLRARRREEAALAAKRNWAPDNALLRGTRGEGRGGGRGPGPKQELEDVDESIDLSETPEIDPIVNASLRAILA
jgi:hypothetical protein